MVDKVALKEVLSLVQENGPYLIDLALIPFIEGSVQSKDDMDEIVEVLQDDYPDILAVLIASAEGEHDNDDGLAPVMDRETEDTKQLQPPRKFNVFILNDDFTTMDFVVAILKQLFSKSEPDAVRITMDVHQKGKGLAGVFTPDIAETKAALVCHLAQEAGFPLRAEAEPE